MKNKLTLLVLSLVLVLIMAACGTDNTSGAQEPQEPQEPKVEKEAVTEEIVEVTEIKIEDRLGETTVKVNPETVVVFDFGILDSLDKLGVEVTGVPQGNIPPYLEKYKDSAYVNVGSLKEPDFEQIADLNPDLIIISGRQLEVADELAKIGPTIFLGVDTNNYLESFKANMETIGQIFTKEAEIASHLAEVDSMIESIVEKTSISDAEGLIVLANEGNVSAYGPGSRFGIIHDVLGVKAVDETIEVSTHGMSISFEYIVEKDPDYLFVIDRSAVVAGDASAKQTIENELVQNTKAYQNDHILYLDPNYWYLSGGGLVSVSEMVKAIDAFIQ